MKRITMLVLSLAATACLSVSAASHVVDYRRTAAPALKLARVGVQASVTMEEGVLQRTDIPRIDAPVLDAELAVGDEISFALFEGVTITLTLRERVPTASGDEAYLAEAAGYEGVRNAVVVRTADGFQVDMQDSKNGKVYSVFSSSRGIVVKESKMPEKPCSCGMAPEVPHAPKASALMTASLPAQADQSSSVFVDVLVAYDTLAEAWVEANGGSLQGFAEIQVQKMNTAIANTGLDSCFRFRLVGTYAIGGSANGSVSAALPAAQGGGTLNGVSWAGLHAKRDEVQADVVSVLIHKDVQQDYGGLGYALRADNEDSFADWAYNACMIRDVSVSHTMTHEVGHNMGAGHSDAMADKSNCGPQYHSYSSGYYFTANGEKYNTIMAYNFDGYGNFYQPVPYFSSPDYCYEGVPVGDALHDNTRTLRQTFLNTSRNRGWVESVPEVGAAIGAPDYAWETGGAHPWTVTAETSTEGMSCARSCEMKYAGEESWLRTCVTGPACLSFDYILRSAGGDFSVSCDDESLFSRGEEEISAKSWESVAVDIPAGTHTVVFRFVHPGPYWPDGLGNGVWLDNVNFLGGSPEPTVWTVTFDSRGGSVSFAEKTVADGESLGDLPTATRVEYDFIGWFDALTDEPVAASTIVSGDMTVYARWAMRPIIRPKEFVLLFDANGGSGHMASYEDSVMGNEVDWLLPECQYVRAGHSFAGWSDTAGDAKAKWNAGDTICTTESVMTLYAIWEELPDDPEEPDVPTLFSDDGPLTAETAKKAWTYNAFVLDGGTLAGTLQVTTAKAAKDGTVKVKATLVQGGRKTALAGTLRSDADGVVELSGKGVSLTVRLGERGLTGVLGEDGEMAVAGARNTLGEKSSAAELAALKRNWTAVFSACVEEDESLFGYAPISISVGAKGATKVSGTLPDGTKVSASTTVVVDEEGLGYVAVDVPLYSKKGSFSALLVLSPEGWVESAAEPAWDTTGAKKPYNVGMQVWVEAGAAADAAAFDGEYAVSVEGEAFADDEDVVFDALPFDVPATVARGKMTLPKAGKVTLKKDELVVPEDNPAGLKLMYTAKTGALKGSFTVYRVEKNKLKSYPATVTGYVVGESVFATAEVKKLGITAVLYVEQM